MDAKSVCHYTSLDGLLGILKEEKIFASSFKDTNDSSEFMYAKSLLKPILKTMHQDVAETLGMNGSEEMFNSDLDKFIDILFNPYDTQLVNCFLFCTSIHKNDSSQYDDGLLSLWRSYTKHDGGVGLLFDTAKLQPHFEKNQMHPKNVSIKYLSSLDEEWSNLVMQHKDGCDSFLKTYFDSNYEATSFEECRRNDFVSLIMELSSSFKHPGFIEEHEYRFIFNGDDSQIKTRKVGGMLKSYIELDLDLKLIDKIILGPSVNQSNLYRKLKLHPKIIKNNLVDKIVMSKIPFVWNS